MAFYNRRSDEEIALDRKQWKERRVIKNDPNEITALIREAKPVIYHTGWLWKDRKDDQTLNIVMEEVYSLYRDGWCFLVQRKIAPYIYQYMSIPSSGAKKRAALIEGNPILKTSWSPWAR